MSVQIIPGILETNEKEYSEKVGIFNSSASLENGWVQIDFADNKFVQNQTIGVDIVKKYPIHLTREAHLMVKEPEDYLEDLKEAGFKRVIFYVEVGRTAEIIKKARDLGFEVGLAIDIETGFSELIPYLDKIDLILLMSIHSGFSGQEFIPDVLEKIRQGVKFRDENGYKYLIEVDGGVNDKNIRQLIDAGVDVVVMTSYLMKGGTIDENLEKIWEAIQG